jgi:general secretion pathway protein G
MNFKQKNFTTKTLSATLRNEHGMTLIEIMIVIAIIGGLLTVLGTTAFNQFEKSRVDTTKISMKTISNALEAYNLSCNTYPTTDQGLASLVTKPAGDACSNWGPGAYLKKAQTKDAWGKEFIYESDGGTFELKSFGKDKKEGGEGYAKDLSSSELE